MQTVSIDKEFEALIPPQTDEELSLLRKSCIEEGIREALIVWNGVIVDGHTRYRIAQEAGLEFDVRQREFETRTDAIKWIIDNQLGRRNLHADAISYLRGKKYLAEKQEEGRPEKRYQNDTVLPERTSEKLAEQFNVGRATIHRDADFVTAVEKLEEADILPAQMVVSGKSPLTKQDTVELAKIVQDEPEKAKEIFAKIETKDSSNIKEAIKTIKKEERDEQDAILAEMTIELPVDERMRVFQSSVSDLVNHIEAGSIDCIITDPPYPKEYLNCWLELSFIASKLLKPGGIVAAMSGQSYLPEIHAMMSEHLTYRWEMAYLTPGGTLTVWQPRIMTGWKPILIYVNGELDREADMLWDVLKSEKQDKDFHVWGQSVSGLKDIVETVSKPGEVVLDPFCGGGSTGIACLELGRKFVGSDIEMKEVNKTITRMEEYKLDKHS